MTRHWAILIGINQYQFRQPLHCAHNDAQAMYDFLTQEADIATSNCILLSDRSPQINNTPTYPTAATLKHWLGGLERAGMQAEDQLWIFFSGYGECWNEQDYLLPIDSEAQFSPTIWLSIRSLYTILSQLPTQNILVMLDMSRSQSARSGWQLGRHTMQIAKEFNIATVLSCQPEQFAHESASLGNGFFTAALLEGLRTQANQPLLQLVRFLQARLPELSEHNYRPRQDPIIMIAPTVLEQWQLPKLKAEPASTATRLSATTLRPKSLSATLDERADNLASQGRNAPLQQDESLTRTMSDEANAAARSAISLDEVSQPVAQITRPQPASSPPRSLTPNADLNTRKVLLQIFSLGILLALVLGLARYLWRGDERPSLLSVGQSGNPTSTTPAVPPANSVAPTDTAATPTASPPNQLQSTDSTKILEDARAMIRPRSAAEVQRAIVQASQIPPGDPRYAEAQRQIDRWCADMMTIAQERAQQGNFREAIAAAKLIPSNCSKQTEQAQPLISQWQQQLR